jgi:hypothetical protein
MGYSGLNTLVRVMGDVSNFHHTSVAITSIAIRVSRLYVVSMDLSMYMYASNLPKYHQQQRSG